MGFFDFIKEDNRIGFAADLLCKLAGFIIAHIARGRADDAGDSELLHKLGHVETDERFGGVKHILREALDQLGLTNTCAAGKDEADRFALGFEADTGTLDSRTDGIDGFILPDDMGFETGIHTGKTLQLPFFHTGSGNLRPELDNTGKVIHGELGLSFCLDTLELLIELHFLCAELGNAGITLVEIFLRVFHIVRNGLGHEGVALKTDIFEVSRDKHG